MEAAPHWGPLPAAPSGSPNVLLIVFDDLGFGQLGCYGSSIATPNIDALAAGGLRYNRFHVTALCSPSRAALLTGRNHHRVGVGFLVDIPLDAPGYHGRRKPSHGTLPQHLVAAGYGARAVGKWHLTPTGSRSHAGPYEMWPLGWGFERYYGFLRGDANHWAPDLIEDNHLTNPPRSVDEGYHLTEDLADRVIRDVRDQRQAAPQKPFFSYFALGAMHAPHHVAREWVDPYRGRFDAGWEAERRDTYERQRDMGLIPRSAVLAPRPPWIDDWTSLPESSRKVFSAMQETYAGFLAHADAQIGRVIDYLRSIDQLDNTIVMVMSDNGASAEGGAMGTFNEHRFTVRMPESAERSMQFVDDWGGPDAYSHYSWGWAWAGNSPFHLWKRYSWLGGTRSPLIVHWPKGIAHAGAVRSQVTHMVDIMPTVLDACGVPVSDVLNGVVQEPLDGASMVDTFTDAAAPSPRQVQYFEMLGSRSIIRGEWKATTDHVSRGVADEEVRLLGSRDFAADTWSLFRLDTDFTEATDVAGEHPDLVAELAALWDVEAARNGVAPLKDDLRAVGIEPLSPPYPPNRTMTYHADGSPVSDDLMPNLGFGGRVTARFEVPPEGVDGVLCEVGDWNGGLALLVQDGRLVLTVSNASEPTRLAAPQRLSPGTHVAGAVFRRESTRFTASLVVDGSEVATTEMPFGMPFHWQHGGTRLTIGMGSGLPVDRTYRAPFRFGGRVHDITFDNTSDAVRPTDELIAEALHVE